MIEMPEDLHKSKLKFIVKSPELSVQLSGVLVKLGAIGLSVAKSETNNEQEIITTAKFDNDERLMAVYDLCQIISHGQVNCTIVD
ncbi:unnamed protein product [Adineta steineri]|uniref:ACT domain-containing protein n=1 Tax=Adineta steineri TaxID=433720 RepID=A0A820M357_9BILA|nr:unnamed protein product [Adineta steineri]